MAQVTGLTKEYMLQLAGEMVTDGEVTPQGHLLLTTRSGTIFDAGVVQGVGATGTVSMFAGAAAPEGHLLCDGSAISRTAYPRLFEVIGTTYGSGNGVSTFNLPNLQGRFPVGRNTGEAEFDTLNEKGGSKTHTLTVAQMPSHTHLQNPHTHTQNSHNHTQNSHGHTQNPHTHTQQAHNHSQNAHNHSQNSHSHVLSFGSGGTFNGDRVGISNSTNPVGSDPDPIGSTTASNNNSTASNNAAVAENDDATATNNATVATNNNTTATNNTTTAVNQSTGGGEAHPILPPYITLNFIIKT